MWGDEKTSEMQRSDEDSTLFKGAIPAYDLPRHGQMVRYWVTASNSRGDWGRKPGRSEKSYGAVVDPEYVQHQGSPKVGRCRLTS